MKLLLIHQNFPGQFKHLAQHLASDPSNQVVFITKRQDRDIPGVRRVSYQPRRKVQPSTHRYLRILEDGVLHGQVVAERAEALKRQGFVPDVVVAHPGWGESLYIKDVFPDTPLLNYFEFFYRGKGSDVGFNPAQPPNLDDLARIRTKNGINLLSLDGCDWGLSPTQWQRRQYPDCYRPMISVIHEGVDTDLVSPQADQSLNLARGGRLTQGDEIITYVSRSLEPYRGFPVFMHAVREICRRRPRAHVLIVGDDGVSYGGALPNGQTYRQKLLSEVELDLSRVHFLGRVPYPQFLSILRISSAHVYLTYPFVLSWSMLEAMSAGCLVIGSATPPVEEVIVDGQNGLLVDFFSPEQIADRVDEVLDHPNRMAALRLAARRTILSQYDLRAVCLPRQLRLIDDLVSGRHPAL